RVLRIRGPTGENDSVNTERGDGKDVKNSNVDIRDDHGHAEQRAAEWNDRDGDDGGHQGKTRRKPVIKSVYVARSEIFLEEKFGNVRDGLKQTGRPDAIRSGTILDECAD